MAEDDSAGERATPHARGSATTTASPEGSPTGGADDREMPGAVRAWVGSLLDLSRRNPLVSLPDAAVPVRTGATTLPGLAAAVAAGVPVTVRGLDDLDDLDIPEGARSALDLDADRLRSSLEDEGIVFAATDTAGIRARFPDLRRRGHAIFEQTGASPLFLTVGGLRVRDEDGTEYTAPLFLLPITLEGRRYGSWTLQLEAQGELHLNECLIERLDRMHGFTPDALRNPARGADGIDLPATFARLRDAIAERDLPLTVEDEARIALLEYFTLEMWRDLHANWRTYLDNDLVAHLAAGGEHWPGHHDDPVAPEEAEAALTLPLPADGSQIRAISFADAGRTFVLDGPPGTGKSQTITNIIAGAVGRGQRVLFVAEKEAALDVVMRRLRGVGLATRCLELRGRDQTAREVRTRLGTALTRPDSGKDAEAAALRHRVRERIEQLATHPRAVREADPAQVPEVDAAARREAVAAYAEETARLRGVLGETLADFPRSPVGLVGEQVAALAGALRGFEGGIRELVTEHIDAVLAVTPCVVASPATVARYLPARAGLFDLVVFDEASQIHVADAVGSMGRGRSVVIVGDPKQMPPTDLFLGVHGEADLEAPVQEESILLEAIRAGVPRLRLTAHYRSRREDLVAFSNERYYGGELVTFPSPASAGSVASMEFRRVPGMFASGRRRAGINLIESNAVVDEVRALIQADPGVSLGIIAFDDAQRDDIHDKLESDESGPAVRAALHREDEPVFVKNLEHVQGDERDHIVFSLAYSLHDGGRLTRDFPLLRRPGGERRLNVAITRARVRNLVFASFEPEALDQIEELPTGLADLRDYLMAARDGIDSRGAATSREHPGDGLGAEIGAALRERGLEVRENVGRGTYRVDLAVRRPGAAWCAVGLDDAAWAARLTVADRDAVPAATLTGAMGWAEATLIYHAEWRRDPEAVLQRLATLAAAAPAVDEFGAKITMDPMTPGAEGADERSRHDEAAGAAPQAQAAPTPPADAAPSRPSRGDEVEETVTAQADAGRAAVKRVEDRARAPQPVLVEFAGADEDTRGKRELVDRIPAPDAMEAVASQWREVVAAEGPIYADRAARIVGHRFGWRRLPFDRRISLMAAIPNDMVRISEAGREFLWEADADPAAYRLVRGQGRAERKFHEIAPEERANAVRLVLAENGGRAGEAVLMRGVREIFGFGLLGTLIKGSLDDVLTRLVQAGELNREGREYVLVPPVAQAKQTEPAPVG